MQKSVSGRESGTQIQSIQLHLPDAKNTHWRKDSITNKYCWENRTSTFRKIKLDSLLLSVKVSSKQIKGFSLRSKTPKLLEEKAGADVKM